MSSSVNTCAGQQTAVFVSQHRNLTAGVFPKTPCAHYLQQDLQRTCSLIEVEMDLELCGTEE